MKIHKILKILEEYNFFFPVILHVPNKDKKISYYFYSFISMMKNLKKFGVILIYFF